MAHFVRTASECLSLCNVLRDSCANHRCEGSKVSEVFHDISLSVATFERLLFSFLKEMMEESGTAFSYSHKLENLLEHMEPVQHTGVFSCGGVKSLMLHIRSVFEDTSECIRQLNSSRRWSAGAPPILTRAFPPLIVMLL